MKRQIAIGELKVGDVFEDTAVGSNGGMYKVSFVSPKSVIVEAYPIWDRNCEHMAEFLREELVEVEVADNSQVHPTSALPSKRSA